MRVVQRGKVGASEIATCDTSATTPVDQCQEKGASEIAVYDTSAILHLYLRNSKSIKEIARYTAEGYSVANLQHTTY